MLQLDAARQQVEQLLTRIDRTNPGRHGDVAIVVSLKALPTDSRQIAKGLRELAAT